MPEEIRIMECGDAYRRADNGAWSKIPVAKTASYTINILETGTTFSNLGASGAVTFTLPIPKAGVWFTFFKIPQQNLILQAPAGVAINGGVAGQKYQNTAVESNKTVTIMAISATAYEVVCERGTWAAAA